MKELAVSFVIAILLLSGCKEEEQVECPCINDEWQFAIFKECEEIQDYAERVQCSHEEFLRAIYTSINYPEKAIKDSIQGTVVVDITIDEKGYAYDFVVINDPLLGYGLEEETIRVLKLVSENGWCPARENCKRVDSHLRMPVKYKL